MNDEETVAPRRRSHVGKIPRRRRRRPVGPSSEGALLEEQGPGWRSGFGSRKGADAITSGLEVT